MYAKHGVEPLLESNVTTEGELNHAEELLNIDENELNS